ncbi:purine-cytosine permease family protein [Sulfoacidibacillus thermotolerans]|uniref:Cytosine permease n=1 Tax=Sulfoacidibacillus thermotolerans TaxID=1765684 RepID=A0A2U3D6P5_SULT2|nr:cytosine permease [Sulfoacidibacillus thermotolerans]PWI56923.1 cytosine permease [Sulfoacidibacillus thermotolerans]
MPGVQQRTIGFIPESDRHGKPSSLFAIWFSANMQVTTIVTGGLAIVLGLNLLFAIIAILLGNLIGGIFMAFHSAQGPKLGIPQMIQSRAQFGVIGAILPLVLVILMYIGFFASSAVLGGQALSAFLHIPLDFSLVIANFITFLLVVYGYEMIHRYERVVSYLFAVTFLFLTIKLIASPAFSAGFSQHQFAFGPFFLVLSIVATWQITYAPYVADYSRYLPKETAIAKTFWYTYAGSVIGSIWMMMIGAIGAATAANAFNASASNYLASLFGQNFSWLIDLVILLGIIAVNVLNLYGGFMSITTTISALSRIGFTSRARTWISGIIALLGTGIAIWGQGNFLNNYSNFLLLLLYFLVPWTSINLIDFYFLRHGHYDVDAIFHQQGAYGTVNWVALISYVVAIALEFPFMNTALYVGVISKYLGNADFAWVVGLLVSGILYYFPMKAKLTRHITDLPL